MMRDKEVTSLVRSASFRTEVKDVLAMFAPVKLRHWCVRESSIRIWTDHGSWPHLVKWGFGEVLHRFPVYARVRETVLLLGSSLSIFPVEVAMLSTSPNVAKSRMALS